MKIFQKTSIALLAITSVVGLVGPMATFAATKPSLGAAETYSILAQTGITGTTGSGAISGNVENNGTGAAITGLTSAMVLGTIFSSNGASTTGTPPAVTTLLSATVQSNASTVYTSTIPGLGIEGTPIVGAELNGITRGPGVYDLAGGVITLSGGVLTLDGPGTYIFRTTGNLTSSGTINFINGARVCDLFWNVGTDATINGTSFAGTILASTGIHFGAGVALNGRALAIGADVTLASGGSISGPTCAAQGGSGGVNQATLNVVKTVINDNGGTATVASFPLFANNTPMVSGVTAILPSNSAYVMTETYDPTKYVQSFSGDCDSTGRLILNTNDKKFCIITNNDIGVPVVVPPVPPLIDVVKVPSPLALPNGPGPVTYNYTLRNIGTVPMSNVTMKDDSCAPVSLISGDVNDNGKLDVPETWSYHCFSTLSATHTNTVVASGFANGITATDLAVATVVVGAPVVPPLIHITKVPSPLALLAGGGSVTYTEKITNPGTVALSNVTIMDDKCAPMKFISGDTNGDSKLDPSETWTYTCTSVLAKTTTNTAVATGQANGFIVRDLAIATVVVAAAIPPTAIPPKLPNTGIAPEGTGSSSVVIALVALLIASVLLFVIRKKHNT